MSRIEPTKPVGLGMVGRWIVEAHEGWQGVVIRLGGGQQSHYAKRDGQGK